MGTKTPEAVLRRDKEYRARNKEEIAARCRERYLKNREAVLKKAAAYYASLSPERKAELTRKKREHAAQNREKHRERSRAWRAANVDKARKSVREHYQRNPDKKREHYAKTYNPARHRERYHADPQFRMMRLLRSRLHQIMKAKKTKRVASTEKLTGCDFASFAKYIESLFQPGMNWQNHGFGPGKWNVDHIRPCASFDLTDAAQQRECFRYLNLQPLWHEENAAKSDKIAA